MICKASKGTVKYLTENSDNSLNFLKRNKVNYVLPIDVPLTCILCIYNQRDHFHITGTSCHVTGWQWYNDLITQNVIEIGSADVIYKSCSHFLFSLYYIYQYKWQKSKKKNQIK